MQPQDEKISVKKSIKQGLKRVGSLKSLLASTPKGLGKERKAKLPAEVMDALAIKVMNTDESCSETMMSSRELDRVWSFNSDSDGDSCASYLMSPVGAARKTTTSSKNVQGLDTALRSPQEESSSQRQGKRSQRNSKHDTTKSLGSSSDQDSSSSDDNCPSAKRSARKTKQKKKKSKPIEESPAEDLEESKKKLKKSAKPSSKNDLGISTHSTKSKAKKTKKARSTPDLLGSSMHSTASKTKKSKSHKHNDDIRTKDRKKGKKRHSSKEAEMEEEGHATHGGLISSGPRLVESKAFQNEKWEGQNTNKQKPLRQMLNPLTIDILNCLPTSSEASQPNPESNQMGNPETKSGGLCRALQNTLTECQAGGIQPLIPSLIDEIKQLESKVAGLEREKEASDMEAERLELQMNAQAEERKKLEDKIHDMEYHAMGNRFESIANDAVHEERIAVLELENTKLRERVATLEAQNTPTSPTEGIDQIMKLKEANTKLRETLDSQKKLIELLRIKIQSDNSTTQEHCSPDNSSSTKMKRRSSFSGLFMPQEQPSPRQGEIVLAISTAVGAANPVQPDEAPTEGDVIGSIAHGFRATLRRASSASNLFNM